MHIVLDGLSAYEYWTSSLSGTAHLVDKPNPALTSFESMSCAELSSRIERMDGSSGPLYLLVREKAERRRIGTVTCACWGSRRLPQHSIYQAGDGIYVISPELCLVRLAPMLSDLELFRATTDLMANYCLSYLDRISIIERKPLISRQDMLEFLSQCRGVAGVKGVRRALRWAVEHTASPRETSVALALALPSHLGGQALAPFEANVHIPLTEEAKHLTRKSFLVADIAWNDGNPLLEYNSDAYHDTEEQLEFDFEKITALQRLHKTTIPLSTRQFNDYDAFSSVCKGIREILGIRDRRACEFEDKRRRTHAKLLEAEKQNRMLPSIIETARWQTLIPYLNTE